VSFSINTNVASLSAQNYLRINSAFQNKTINRVTSGLRITQSGDDAAGLAIANGLRSDQAVLTQGIRNANDGMSQLQIIDGGMNNISQLLDRARTLATQSATGTFTGQRSQLNTEFQSVLGEIDRQSQSIGLNVGGQFAKNLSVFIGGGKESNGISAVINGSVSVDLSKSTVDAQSLGLKGVQATGVAATDIGTGSANTSLAQILANSTNTGSELTPNSATFYLKGPGFGSQGVAVTVNLQNLGGTDDLVNSINAGISGAAGSGTQQATALKNAQITASVVTDAAGRSQLAFSSSNAAFQVVAGDQMANALMGNFAQNAVALGTDTNAYTDTTGGQTLSFKFDAVSTQYDVTTLPNSLTTSKGAIVNALNADSNFKAHAVAYLQNNQLAIKSLDTGSDSGVTVVQNALAQTLGLTTGSTKTYSAASASTGADLSTRVQAAGVVAENANVMGTDNSATKTMANGLTLKLHLDNNGNSTVTFNGGTNLTKADIAAQINAAAISGVQASVVNNQIVLSSTAPGHSITVDSIGTANASLGFSAVTPTTVTDGNGTFTTSDNIVFRFQGAGLTSPVDVSLNAATAGSTTVASVVADLQNKISSNTALAGAGISLTTAAQGNNLVFTSTSGQQFQVSVTGDTQNKLGFGSFQAGSTSAKTFDYSDVTAASSYSQTYTSGSGTGDLAISLNGAASSGNVLSATVDGAASDATAAVAQGGTVLTGGTLVFTGAAGPLNIKVDNSIIAIATGTLGTGGAVTLTAALTALNGAGGLNGAATASIDSSGKLIITAANKGAGHSVEILASSDSVYTTALGLSTGTVYRGTNASEQNIIDQLNTDISQNTTLSAAGLQAKDSSASPGKIELVSASSTNFRVDSYGTADLGFGNLGASFTGNKVSAPPQSTPVFDSGGAEMSSVLGFNDITYGGDKQLVSITAMDASGGKHPLTVTLQNSGSNRNARTIDDAISSINTALQQSNDSTLEQIVAVKEDNTITPTDGSQPYQTQSIRFISTLPNFTVAVSNTAGGTGITPPTGGVSQAGVVGDGANSSVVDQNSAQNAVTAISNAVTLLGNAQATVGKGENMFNYAINLAQSQSTNLATSESGIRDADLAAEAANLTKAQILLQAGVAALAQANSAPQAILSLLRS